MFREPVLNVRVREMAAFYAYSGCHAEADRSDGRFRTRIIGSKGEINYRLFEDWVDDINFIEGIGYQDEYPTELWRDAVAREIEVIRAHG